MRKLALFLLASCLLACGDGGHEAPSLPLVGIGTPRNWHLRNHASDAQASRDNRAGLDVIELNPAVRGEQRSCKRTPDELGFQIEEAGKKVRANQKQGITTLINIINANGCLDRELNEQALAALATSLIAVLSSTEHVILCAVSEPWVDRKNWDKWLWFTQFVRDAWQGSLAMPASSGASNNVQPAFPSVSYEWIDFHACSDSLAMQVLGTPGVIVNTDCRGILNPGPVRVLPLAKRARETGGALVFYSGPDQPDPSASLAAIGST